jgi:GNAT superfamily N-acetyltransferase
VLGLTPALHDDLPTHVAFAREAQAFLRDRGLAQWVPAAHPPHLPRLAQQVDRGELLRLDLDGVPVAFFALSQDASEWWPADGVRAAYVSGIVVDRARRGMGLGGIVLRRARDWARRYECVALRLDCHAGNDWLCPHDRERGFVDVGRVPQHPGYVGVLFEQRVEPD